jgi:hypothetical protein
MNVSRSTSTRRLSGLLIAFGALTAMLAAGGTAMAAPLTLPGGGGNTGPSSLAPAVGGMPGWQITLIAVAAALVAAVLAVLADRARAARKRLAAGPQPASIPAQAAVPAQPGQVR